MRKIWIKPRKITVKMKKNSWLKSTISLLELSGNEWPNFVILVAKMLTKIQQKIWLEWNPSCFSWNNSKLLKMPAKFMWNQVNKIAKFKGGNWCKRFCTTFFFYEAYQKFQKLLVPIVTQKKFAFEKVPKWTVIQMWSMKIFLFVFKKFCK